ncbi:bifunctional aspartokinase/homoserine dehydrogenase 1 [Monoraphidium neglectum]|uniref:Homoserine dehydrogenase n=1 Tax=Monoraphidium neglectum TaxID=145388 RepID=A0A0D2LBX9_9CHLO|nr:bifunctional aspartokinase/homoserine dehydrogenase 1 [Monoraphidium neglectum]KIZ04254.1 bifunctional aspartokinase/homoserine dehydrogenase 1 [Monoraphidium neglectum]|eukprot:XP_013903273.1 bifunctional aspartokinase/homoserine dehydrogenase 1 [Monoraphidium neglectum]
MGRLCVGLIGPGLIGKSLVQQLGQQTPYLRDKLGIHLSLVAVANSKRQLLADVDAAPLQLAGDWLERLQLQGAPLDLPAFARHVSAPGGWGVIVDCTASDSVPDHYESWLGSGLHVVTPNKKYSAALRAARGGGARLLAEASVGAGLPVLSTLRDLVETGDQVTRIEGILSGTLSYIFNTFRPGTPFSSVVAAAKDLGYTEPDPREDLSGMDVARKVVILARACGLSTELEDLRVESLVPEPLQALPGADEFMARLPEFDAEMAQRADAAAAEGGVLRYVGVVDVASGTASVTLQSFPADHAFAQLQGSDNLIAFTTQRYAATPLIVRGPGAGAAVTAAGVFGDILQIARSVAPRPAEAGKA